MSLGTIIAWAWENKEIIGLFAVVATAFGALYQPTRDFLSFLPRAAWAIITFVFVSIWVISWPVRKLVAVLLATERAVPYNRRQLGEPISLITKSRPQ